jgi:hypothetical protein
MEASLARFDGRISDMSGDVIPPRTGARVRIEFYDGERVARRADLTDAEVEKLLPFAQEVETRPERRRARAEL